MVRALVQKKTSGGASGFFVRAGDDILQEFAGIGGLLRRLEIAARRAGSVSFPFRL
jgi:hypothetical protein